MPKLPSLSIAAKLYTIFALLATATLALAGIALVNVHHQTAMTRTTRRRSAARRTSSASTGLIYAVVMESRGIYMSPDIPTAKRYGDCCSSSTTGSPPVVQDWRKNVRSRRHGAIRGVLQRIAQFIEFRKELVRLGTEVSPPRAASGATTSQPQRAHRAQPGSRQARRDL